MTIRQAKPEDIKTIADFQQNMAKETEGLRLDGEVLFKGVSRVLQDPAKGFYLLVEDQDEVIASMLLTPEWSDWRNCLFLWIQSLYVLPEYRQKGIFRMMYGHVKKMVSDSPEYAGLKLYVDEGNTLAQSVYTKVGMTASHYNLFEWNKFEY